MNFGFLTNLFIGGAIALLPLYTRISNLDLNRTSKDNLLLAIFICLMAILPDRIRSLPKTLWILFAYAVINVVLNQWNPTVVNVQMQSFYIIAGVAFFVSFYEKHDESSLHLILNGMAIGAIIQSILGITDYFDYDLYENVLQIFTKKFVIVHVAVTKEITGSLGHCNLLGSYLALTLPAFFRKGWQWVIPLQMAVVIMSKSMMGMGAMLAACLYFINARYQIIQRSWVYLGTIIAMASMFLFGLNGLDSQRFDAWRKIFSWVDDKHFFLGMGPGWFSAQRLMLVDGLMAQEHSGFIAAFNVLGIISFMLAAPAFIKYVFSKNEDPIFSACFYAAFCSSFGHFTLHQSTVAIIIVVVAAICLARGNKHEFNMER